MRSVLLFGCAVVLGFYIFSRQNYPCPDQPHILANNVAIVSRYDDRCFIWLPNSGAPYQARSAYLTLGGSKYILITQPLFYLGRLMDIEAHQNKPNKSEFVLNQAYLQLYLADLQLRQIQKETEILSSKLQKLESVNLDSESRFNTKAREELFNLRSNIKAVNTLINELEQLERGVEAFLRIQPGGRALLSLKNYQNRVTYRDGNYREIFDRLREIEELLDAL